MMNRYVMHLMICIIGASSSLAHAAPTALGQLPDWQKPAGASEPIFIGDRQVQIWGRKPAYRRAYSPELLPALFQRTLVIEHLDPANAELDWIFTGDLGGVTVSVGAGHLVVRERFYDSFGLNKVEDPKFEAGRHAEKEWICGEATFSGELKAVTVTMDHGLQVLVALNGKTAIQTGCLFDLSRHQLQLVMPKDASQGSLRGAFLRPAPVETTVTINRDSHHQKMIGFGGITSPAAYAELSPQGKRRWWELIAEYNLLIRREYPIGTRLNPTFDNWDRLEDATPHYYADNFPNGEISNFAYIKTIRKLGGQAWFEFWNLPDWAKQDWTDGSGKLYQGVAKPDKYVEAMIAYCRACQAKSGAPPEIVGVQNEQSQPDEIYRQMTLGLRKGLDDAGFKSVRIHMSDSGRLHGGIPRLKVFRRWPEVWSSIDFAATHMYDYQGSFHDPDKFDAKFREWSELTGGKPFLSTELCINSGAYQIKSYRAALVMGELYHKNLTIMNASALCYCWLLINVTQPSYGWTRTLFVPDTANGSLPVAGSFQARVFGAFSRRIRPGMTRVDATTPDSMLFSTAYVDDHGETTVILLNRGNAPRRVHWDGLTKALPFVERCSPYLQNAVAGPAEDITVLPGEIITLSSLPLGKLPADFTLEQ